MTVKVIERTDGRARLGDSLILTDVNDSSSELFMVELDEKLEAESHIVGLRKGDPCCLDPDYRQICCTIVAIIYKPNPDDEVKEVSNEEFFKTDGDSLLQ